MARIGSDIGRDSVGLNEFAKRVERLCRFSDISVLLYKNGDGLFLGEIVSALGAGHEEVVNALDILVRDEMVEEDRTRQCYMLGDTAVAVFDLNSNDSTVTLESRLTEIANKLKRYASAVENGNEVMRRKLGSEITSYLYQTYNRTRNELNQLKAKVENEYKVERNLRYKSETLAVYIGSIEEIMYSLDVSRPPQTDAEGNRKVYRNLKQMLNEDVHYGKDYRLAIEGFFKNCDAKLSNQILELYNLFRVWWGKTKVALEDFRCASLAFEALLDYNPGNEVLRTFIEESDAALPPVHRRFGKESDADGEACSIDLATRILDLDSVNEDEFEMVSSCCASLHYDFVSFKAVGDQDVPPGMLDEKPQYKVVEQVDLAEELLAFRSYGGTLLEFVRSRYPDLEGDGLLHLYFKLCLQTGSGPALFDDAFEAVFPGERFGDDYDIVTLKNRTDRNGTV